MMLDIIGIALVLIFFIRGYMKGIIVAVFSMLAIILGLICSLKLSECLASFLSEKHIVSSGWCQVACYVLIFIAVLVIVRIIAKALQSAFEAAMLGWVNKSIGGLLYAFMICIVWSSFLWIGSQMSLIAPETITASKTYPYFVRLAPWLFNNIGKVWPMAKYIFLDLELFFKTVNTHVGTA